MTSEEDVSRSANGDKNKDKEKGTSQRKRGQTTAKYVTKDDDGPYPLQWNDYGVAVGEYKDKYTTYTRDLERAKVKISIENWNLVEQDVKEKIWTTTKVGFSMKYKL